MGYNYKVTPQEFEKIVARYLAGERIADLAREHGINSSSLQQRLIRAGHYKARNEMVGVEKGCGYIKVATIGDMHDSPFLGKSRFTALGQWIVRYQPDYVVQIGDWATMDSLNTHIDNSTTEAKTKPTFTMDLDSLKESLEALHAPIEAHNARCTRKNGLKPVKPKFVFTMGNHEARMLAYGNRNPEVGADFHNRFVNIMNSFGWEVVPYKEYYYIEQVAFTHAPHNGMGKPMGGENTSTNAANKLTHDLVHGHTHRGQVIRKPKIGDQNAFVTVIDLGTALPYGHIEDYAKHGVCGWTWGAWELLIRNRIEAWNFVPMDILEKLNMDG